MNRRLQLIVAVITVVAIAVGGIYWLGKGKPSSSPLPAGPGALVALVPTQSTPSGVEATTGFRLTSERALDLADVQKSLTVQPAVDLRVEPVGAGGREFRVMPSRSLDANRVYRFRLAASAGVDRTYQWSFQTRAEFRVLGSLPRHQGQGVPLNSGIEITFSHEDWADIEPFFEISPKVPGRFERHKKTAVFVPTEKFAEGTVYTVTLKKGVGQTQGPGAIKEDFSFAFETIAQTGEKGEVHFSLPTLQEFTPDTAPFFQVSYYARDKNSPPPMDVAVYRYSDAAAFVGAVTQSDRVPSWSAFARSRYHVPTDGLERVASFKAEAKQLPNVGLYLMYPEPLRPGYYVATFKAGDLVRESLFQVTDLSSYAAMTTTQTLVWFNDLATKAPAAGTKLKALGAGHEATADKDGVAVLPTPQGATPQFYLHATAPGGKEAVVPLAGLDYWYWSYWGRQETAALYWKYLYLDRALYKPADKVNLWGIVRPREPGAKPVTEVTAEVVRSDGGGYGNRPMALATATIPVVDSTFTGSVALPNLRPGSYQLTVRMGEEYLVERWFEVQTYTKPAYDIDVTTDKRAIFLNETAQFQVKAAFFEGTPVPGLRLNYSVSGASGQVTTDGAGEAAITFRPDSVEKNYYGNWGGPSTAWFQVNADLPETGPISAQSTLMVFPRNVTFAPTVTVQQGQATFTGQADHIDLDQINAGGNAWEYKGAPAADRTVRGQLVEHRWIREDAGEYYDFIQKTVQKAYRYREERTQVGSFTSTTDSAGRFTHTMTIEPEKSYEVQLQLQDTNGNWVEQSLWFSGKEYQGYNDSFYRYYNLDAGAKSEWGLGEQISLVFRENQRPTEDRARGYLFYTARQGLQSYKVQDQGTFRTALREQDLPNTNIKAVFFDGRRYREAQERTLRFDAKERELKVTITPDKQEYRPGDTVGLAIRVIDKNGKPVKAQVNLNLVDEALFALEEQYVNLLGQLYGEHMTSGVLRSRSSHFVPEPGNFAEKGGDGGGARKDFQDAIYFATVATDDKGVASASFKVPDNLTSWRVTWHALAPGSMEAAHGTAKIPVRLPFFIDTVIGESYLTGDKPVITLRSYGTAMQAKRQVYYGVKLTAPDGSVFEQRDVEGTAFAPTAIPLPALKPGTYTVRVSAGAAGGLHDEVEQTFTVVDSYLRQNKVDFFTLSEGLKVKGAEKGITTLTFTDLERSRYLQLLQQLQWQWGNRFEQKLARSVAADLLEEHFGAPKGSGTEELNTLAYQTPAGSVAILPYSDGDLLLSVLAADLAPDRFDQGALQLYFEKILADAGAGREQAILALYGLAALEQPVLLEAQSLLKESNLTPSEQLYLALTLAVVGDHEGARPLFYSLLEKYSEQVGSAARIKEGRDQDEILTATALAGMLAAKLGEPHAPAFAEYLSENPTKEVLLLLEEAILLRDGLPQLAVAPAAFTYELNGKSERVELKAGQPFRLPVSSTALETLKFREIQGKVGLAVEYEGPLAAADVKQQSGFKVSRSYDVRGKAGQAIRPGDVVVVTLSYTIPGTAPGGGYEISDYLPSGLKLIERPWQFGAEPGKNWRWPAEVNGQKVTFYAGKDGGPIVYYARVTGAGSYRAQEPILQHQRSGLIYSSGAASVVEIK